MNFTIEQLQQIIQEELEVILDERCEKGYKTHPTRKTKEMYGKTYRNCVKADEGLNEDDKVKKDACYKKIKGAVKRKGGTWPSAYASGRLVQCRKVGAANWKEGEPKKEGKQSSEDAGRLDKWFKRKGEKGSKGGWVNCNRPDGDGGYKECAREKPSDPKPYCRPTPSACKTEPKQNESRKRVVEVRINRLKESNFKPHMMYDPKSNKKVKANKVEDHEGLAKKGYTHVDPAALRKVLKDEGGASGMDPFVKAIGKGMEDEIKKTLDAMPDVGQHKDKDYILDDKGEIDIIKEDELEEKKGSKRQRKKKACKPSKGKRFAKRVDGKCRSFGQKGQAKGGGDRIRPGTKKGDAYCARSAKIKKCKNPPCANALSRKKWKCRGSKSMK